MSETGELITVQPAQGAVELYRRSLDVAKVCKEIVELSSVQIGPSRHVRVEGWQSIAICHGCFPGAGEAERAYDMEGNHIGYKAKAYVRDAAGNILSTGDGFVGFDEKDKRGNFTWKGRAEYAGRAMAQTRALSRACRSAFAHVVVLMKAGLSTTPAEEIIGEEQASTSGTVIPAPQDHPGKPPRGTITSAQLTKLGILCKQVGYEKTHLQEEYDLVSRTLLSREQASELIERLQEKANEMPLATAEG